MISSLVTPPAALALDYLSEVKSHVRLDSDDEKSRLEAIVIPAAAEWAEALTNRQLITATWLFWFSSFDEACCAARQRGSFPSDTILIPRPPLQSVTHVKYYDTANVLQTWAAANYNVALPAGPKAGPGWIRPVPNAAYPNTHVRPDAVEIKVVAGYGDDSSDVPGGLRAAMLLLVGELFARREEAVQGTIIQQVPLAAQSLALGYLVEV